MVLVTHGEALRKSAMWPALRSLFYGPCKVVKARHPRYQLVSSTGKYTLKPIHSRRVVKYHHREE